MSLTSYRAAPPRVNRLFAFAKMSFPAQVRRTCRESVTALRLCLVPEQIAEGDLSPLRDARGVFFYSGLERQKAA